MPIERLYFLVQKETNERIGDGSLDFIFFLRGKTVPVKIRIQFSYEKGAEMSRVAFVDVRENWSGIFRKLQIGVAFFDFAGIGVAYI